MVVTHHPPRGHTHVINNATNTNLLKSRKQARFKIATWRSLEKKNMFLDIA